jgi:hypothetical protein
MFVRAVVVVLIFAAVVSSPVVAGEDPKLADQTFVGNWFVFFNPTKGGGTQQLAVDVDESGSYIATDQNGQLEPVAGQLEAKGGKFILRARDGAIIDQGTYELMGPQLQLAGALGKGFWTRMSGESKQGAAKNLDGNLKAANIGPIIADAIKAARAKWQKDAILVEAKVVPNDDGTIDLTAAGGNGYLRFLSPGANKGCLGTVGNFGEVNLFPEAQPISISRWSIPTNVIDLQKAMSKAEGEGAGAVKEAALYGCGEDTDLRQFCWVLKTQDSVVAVDALLGDTTDYREFMDGRQRAEKVPFMPNKGTARFSYTYDGQGPPEMMWAARHPVFLDGMDEAVIVQVPWRIIPKEEILQHATRTADGIQYRGESELYPIGEPTALADEILTRFLRDNDSIRIGCAPFAVRTEKPLAEFPKGTRERIVKQLEEHWRAKGGR